jgi:hypothetical protein
MPARVTRKFDRREMNEDGMGNIAFWRGERKQPIQFGALNEKRKEYDIRERDENRTIGNN